MFFGLVSSVLKGRSSSNRRDGFLDIHDRNATRSHIGSLTRWVLP